MKIPFLTEQANLKNMFVSPYPTLLKRERLVDIFFFSSSKEDNEFQYDKDVITT